MGGAAPSSAQFSLVQCLLSTCQVPGLVQSADMRSNPTSHIICGVQCKMKTWGPLLKIIKNFQRGMEPHAGERAARHPQAPWGPEEHSWKNTERRGRGKNLVPVADLREEPRKRRQREQGH